MSYIDGFVAAVPTHKKAEYLAHVQRAWVIMQEFGALQMVECWGEDVPEGAISSMPKAVHCRADETVVFSWIVWPSRETRMEAMPKFQNDPRMQAEMHSMPFDAQRVIYGGFETLFESNSEPAV